jgi:hypothetical protein
MWRRSAKTAKKQKKHRNRQKSNTTKHQNKYQDGGGGGRGKGMGAPGLGTLSKLLELSAKGTWEGGILPPL